MKSLLAIAVAVVFALTSRASGDLAGGGGNNNLHVIFLGWFDKEQVEVYTSDQKNYSAVITTDPTSEYSAAVDIPLRTSPARLKVCVPRLSLLKAASVELTKGRYLYVALDHNKISFQQTQKPLALD